MCCVRWKACCQGGFWGRVCCQCGQQSDANFCHSEFSRHPGDTGSCLSGNLPRIFLYLGFIWFGLEQVLDVGVLCPSSRENCKPLLGCRGRSLASQHSGPWLSLRHLGAAVAMEDPLALCCTWGPGCPAKAAPSVAQVDDP